MELSRAQSEKPGNRLRVNDVLLMALLGHVSRAARNSTREFSRRRDSNLAHLKVSARRETKEKDIRENEREREKWNGTSVKKWLIGSPESSYAFCQFSTVYQSHAKFIFLQVIDITHDGRRAILETIRDADDKVNIASARSMHHEKRRILRIVSENEVKGQWTNRPIDFRLLRSRNE